MEIKTGGIYRIVPHDETGDRTAAPEEFNSVEKAEEFLDQTKERWAGFQSIQIVDKRTGKVVDVW